MSVFWLTVYFAALFALYKLIDRLIRIPRIRGRYNDRYILVTGCDTGFGNLLAKRLDQFGCHVFAGCLTEKGETELKKVSSERLYTFSLDVTNEESIQKALHYVRSKLPEEKGLWGVVNNAGILANAGPPEWIRLEDYKKHCEVNLWGTVKVTFAFMSLIKKEKGRVVNMASIAGRTTFADYAPYCISKHGVEVFTDALRRRLRPFGCKAILLEPGVHKTTIVDESQLISIARRTFDKADPGIREEYGEAYANYLSSDKGIYGLLSNGSDRITDVIDAYEHALFGLVPRPRYMMGWDALYVYMPIHYLPEWLGDWLYDTVDHERPRPSATIDNYCVCQKN